MHNLSGATGAAVVATLSVTLALAGLGLGTFDRDPTELGASVQGITPAHDGTPLTSASQVPPAPPIEIDAAGRPKLPPFPEQLPRPPAPEGIVPVDPTEPLERDLFSPVVPWLSTPADEPVDQSAPGLAIVPPEPSPTATNTPPDLESEIGPGQAPTSAASAAVESPGSTQSVLEPQSETPAASVSAEPPESLEPTHVPSPNTDLEPGEEPTPAASVSTEPTPAASVSTEPPPAASVLGKPTPGASAPGQSRSPEPEPGTESETPTASASDEFTRPTPEPPHTASANPGTSAPAFSSASSSSGTDPQVDPPSPRGGDRQDETDDELCADPSGWRPTPFDRGRGQVATHDARVLHRTEAKMAPAPGEGVALTTDVRRPHESDAAIDPLRGEDDQERTQDSTGG